MCNIIASNYIDSQCVGKNYGHVLPINNPKVALHLSKARNQKFCSLSRSRDSFIEIFFCLLGRLIGLTVPYVITLYHAFSPFFLFLVLFIFYGRAFCTYPYNAILFAFRLLLSIIFVILYLR